MNELLRQELSIIMHTRFQKETVDVTLTEVDVAPDHRSARVYYSVIGGEARREAARVWFSRLGREMQFQLAKKVTLKHTPRLTFAEDVAVERGNRILDILGSIRTTEDEARPAARPAPEPAGSPADKARSRGSRHGNDNAG